MARVAARADVPVLPVVGVGGRQAAASLRLLPEIRVVHHPRAATLLVVAGRPTRALLRPLMLVHDQLPTPRGTVWWPTTNLGGEDLMASLGDVSVGQPGDDAGLRRTFVDVVQGTRRGDRATLLDIDPAPWRGIGPYGQGGTGMTGGTPFGRPLAGRQPDPDGLQLDQLPLQVGPIFPPLPPGLVLHLGVQGDVIRTASLGDNPFALRPGDPALGPFDTQPFFDAGSTPTPIGPLEVARARHHLRWAGNTLRLYGLSAMAHRLLALADQLHTSHQRVVARVVVKLRRSRTLRSAMSGIGLVAGEDLRGAGGPTARACGLPYDARLDDPAYRALRFEPIVHESGDAWARFCQRLAEAEQALTLAQAVGDGVRAPGPAVESPRGPLHQDGTDPSAALLPLLPDLLVGQEWGDAMTIVVSLDLDLEEAAVAEVATKP